MGTNDTECDEFYIFCSFLHFLCFFSFFFICQTKHINNLRVFVCQSLLINRPGLARAFLLTPLSLIMLFILFVKICKTPSLPNHKSQRPDILRQYSQTPVCHVENVTCHMLCVMCHVSGVRCNMSNIINKNICIKKKNV